MRGDKIRAFMQLAGQRVSEQFREGSEEERKLGAQLLLSEVLEYVIEGLGVTPVFDGKAITDPNGLHYTVSGAVDRTEMADGLSDVAYTMYWNALAFGVPLEKAFDLVCDNNLEKFVRLDSGSWSAGQLARDAWGCGCEVEWPSEVERVEVIFVEGTPYAVGKDGRGKVRKPSTYRPVDLSAVA